MAKRGRTPVMYTLERAEEVKRRVRAGERITAVTRDMGMDHSNFLRWCRRNKFTVHTKASRQKAMSLPKGPYNLGEKVSPLRKPRPGGRAEKIAAALKDGVPPHEAAKQFGVCYEYVIRLRKLVGLNPPAGKGRNISHGGPRKNRASKRNDEILHALRNGAKQIDLARKYGVSQSCISLIKRNAERAGEL